jgi:hypothetical protein
MLLSVMARNLRQVVEIAVRNPVFLDLFNDGWK